MNTNGHPGGKRAFSRTRGEVMGKLNLLEANKVVLGLSLMFILVCMAFMLQMLIGIFTKADVDESLTIRPPLPETPTAQRAPEPALPEPTAQPAATPETPPSENNLRRTGDPYMDRIIENKEIQRKQIQYLRANSREKGGGADALSEKEIDEMERKGLMLQ